AHWFDELINGELALVEIVARARLKFLESLASEIQKRLIILPKRVCRERLESVAQLRLSIFEERELFSSTLALLDPLRFNSRDLGAKVALTRLKLSHVRLQLRQM